MHPAAQSIFCKAGSMQNMGLQFMLSFIHFMHNDICLRFASYHFCIRKFDKEHQTQNIKPKTFHHATHQHFQPNS